ncbi:MAG: hypothetical protein EXR98_13795 [Gemmataceae bacterium]|nr:hypothetical protein [Gemmataceae bacterium]
MHRTFFAPRQLGWWSLLVTLALFVGIYAVSAQDTLLLAPKGIPQAQNIELAVGMTHACQMTTHADLKRVANPNSKVVRVERIADKNNEVFLIGETPGRTLITFVDQNDRSEVHEVIVQAVAGRESGGKEAAKGQKLKMNKGTQETRKLDKASLGGVTITKSDIVDVKIAADDPTGRTVTFRALGVGTTRVTFYADAKKQEIVADYVVEVTTTDRAAQLRALITEIAPAAAVTVTETRIPRKRPNQEPRGKPEDDWEFDEAVILSGTASSAMEARVISDAAQRLFPPTDLGQGAIAVGGGVAQQSQLQGNVINNIQIGGVHQIQLDVVIAIVNRSELRNMSFSWTLNGTQVAGGSILGPGTFANALTTGLAGATYAANSTAQLPFAVQNNHTSFMSFLQALRTEGLTKIISEPRVTTMSGRPATIVSGGQVPVLVGSTGGTSTVEYKDFGTVVNFLPIVLANGKIHLEVKSEISDVDPSLTLTIGGIQPTSIAGFRKRGASVTVQLGDGQTLAIGGLIQNSVKASMAKIPFLGDIPFLGAAFSTKTFNEVEEEMLIIVTPRLVDGVDCTKIPKYLPGQETRSADDFELFLEGIMEAPRGPRSVFLRHYKGAHTLSSNAGQIPCGDGSCNPRDGKSCASGDCAPGSHGALNAPRTTKTALPRLVTPTPSFPELPTIPTTTPPATVESEVPAVLPQITPANPMSSRQPEFRPLLPPIGR